MTTTNTVSIANTCKALFSMFSAQISFNSHSNPDPHWQGRKPEHREVKRLHQSHTARTWKSQHLKPIGLPKVHIINHLCVCLILFGVLAGYQITFVIKKEREGEKFQWWCELWQCSGMQALSSSTETTSHLCDLRQLTEPLLSHSLHWQKGAAFNLWSK